MHKRAKMNFLILACTFLFLSIQHLSCKNLKCPQPYSSCNLGKDGTVNVHLVSHTHDDVGWLKTVDQYYYGSNADQQEATVQYILDTVIPELEKDPNKRFVYVEMAFFWRWWNEQTESMKQLVRTLVNEGRLEFVNGGWCMNDEASTYYNDIIDQQTLGLKFILNEFGECARPRSAWQVDPFGHSREQASLFAQFGFDGLFLGRVDYEDHENRGATKTREMLWQASANLGKAAELFTGVLHYGYNPPPGFCFDQYCTDEPIMDDPNLDEYNVDKKVNEFINYTLGQAQSYKTNHLIMTMGSDFQYSNAHRWFKNLDKLIHYVNRAGNKVNVFYSTTACYLYSLNRANQTWPIKYDDFFPYAHRPHAFWTGYFTSRAALKYYVRRTNNFLQSIRHLALLANLNDDQTVNALARLERAMGVAQHHDAVSGTERQHVANDYAKRLSDGINDCLSVLHKSLNKLSNKGIGDAKNIHFCSLLNITQCDAIENQDEFTLVVYNPLPRNIHRYLQIPLISNDYSVYEANTGKQIFSEIKPVYYETQQIPERKSSAKFQLVFQSKLPPLGFQVYSINKKSYTNLIKQPRYKSMSRLIELDDKILIKNIYLQLTFDLSGNLLQLDNLDTKLSTQLTQQFCWYKSRAGNNSVGEFQASGAYVFRPDQQRPEQCLSVMKYALTRGKQFNEIHQIFNEYISQTIRLYENRRDVEFEWQVGPIPIEDDIGKEIIMRFQSDLKTNSAFYTDSNGRETVRRQRDFRPTWKLNNTEPIAGNYYPINSRIFIRDENQQNRQLTLVTDRSQGASSILDGSVEVMLHRRILNDDALGVSEPLNETGINGKGLVVNGMVNLLFNSSDNSARLHRELSHQISYQPLLTFVTSNQTKENTALKDLSNWSALKYSLPENVHLLTFMKDYDDMNNQLKNTILIRLEHFYELNEDPILSQSLNIDLRDVFNQTFELLGFEELALGANMNAKELNERLKWMPADTVEYPSEEILNPNEKNNSPFTISLTPMQIRTFRLWFIPKS